MDHRYAEPADVLDAAHSWDDDQIACRSLTSHGWESYTVREVRVLLNKPLRIIQRCAHCGNERSRLMSSHTGEWLQDQWSYRNQPGYGMPKGKGRVGTDGKAALRLLAIRHLDREVADA